MSTLNFIDLALRRRVCLRQGSAVVGYYVKPIAEAQWFKFFDGIVSTAVRDGKQIVQHTDATSAGLGLVADALKLGDDAPPVPLAHRLAIANILTSAYVPTPEETAAQEEMPPEAVRLYTIWGAGDGEGDAMRRFKNLVHWFDAPSAEQYRRYRRDDSRAQIVSGSRKGTTIYRGAQRTLAALYDELIVNVAGYAVNGTDLQGREQISLHMDTYHKVSAALGLFSAAVPEIEEDEA